VNLVYTYHWITEKIKTMLSQDGITMQQFNILRILRGSDPQPLSTLTIRERMLDKMSDTSRIVDRLVLKGWVIKRTCASDKRLVDVSITKDGKRILEKIDKRIDDMNAVVSSLSQQDLKRLNELLDQMRS
jgi:DNA-binding MarR family transcriptional regulator